MRIAEGFHARIEQLSHVSSFLYLSNSGRFMKSNNLHNLLLMTV